MAEEKKMAEGPTTFEDFCQSIFPQEFRFLTDEKFGEPGALEEAYAEAWELGGRQDEPVLRLADFLDAAAERLDALAMIRALVCVRLLADPRLADDVLRAHRRAMGLADRDVRRAVRRNAFMALWPMERASRDAAFRQRMQKFWESFITGNDAVYAFRGLQFLGAECALPHLVVVLGRMASKPADRMRVLQELARQAKNEGVEPRPHLERLAKTSSASFLKHRDLLEQAFGKDAMP